MYRRYYNRRKPESTLKSIIGFCGLLFIIYSFGGPAARSTLGWLFLVVTALVFGIFLFKTIKSSGASPGSSSSNFNQADIRTTAINTEKHGCKCFLEGLSGAEQDVANILSRDLSYKEYFLFNNLIIPFENTGSTQIDHVVISRFGVFVIETKDYKGWIFGSQDQSQWTQSLPGGRRKFQFQNPIHQNYAHILGLQNLFSFPVDYFQNIVVFSDRSTFKSDPIPGVLHLSELTEYIMKDRREILTEKDLEFAIGKLSFLCQTNDITLSQHISNLQAAHASV